MDYDDQHSDISSLDPLDKIAHRTRTHDDHDFGGVSALPSDFARRESWTSFKSRRDSKARRDSVKENAIHEEESHQEEDEEENSDTHQGDLEDATQTLVKAETTRSQKKRNRKVAFWKVARMFGTSYLIIFCVFLGFLSIYWGSWYDRAAYLHRLNYLVVSEESPDVVEPLITETFINVFNSSGAHKIGTFHFVNASQFGLEAKEENRSNWEEIISRVHQQHYWGGFYIPANATGLYLESLRTLIPYNDSVRFVYESGRNPTAVSGYVVSPVNKLEKSFVQLAQKYIMLPLISNLTTEEKTQLITNGTQLLSNLWFQRTDYRPYDIPVIIGPLQVGLIYLLVMSFHQFNFASTTHEVMRTKLRPKQYMVYHLITSHLAYLILGLVYCLMTAAFSVPYDRTFGTAGFFVEWAFVYLIIAAMGGLNENVALQIFARNKPFIGFWIVFFMVSSLAPVFSPIAIINQFYRYGYAMPMYCGHQLLNVVFLDTTKKDIGRNIGILIAWIVLMNIILPFNIRSVERYKKKVEERARKTLKAEQ
jgi:hypothetical protein